MASKTNEKKYFPWIVISLKDESVMLILYCFPIVVLVLCNLVVHACQIVNILHFNLHQTNCSKINSIKEILNLISNSLLNQRMSVFWVHFPPGGKSFLVQLFISPSMLIRA